MRDSNGEFVGLVVEANGLSSGVDPAVVRRIGDVVVKFRVSEAGLSAYTSSRPMSLVYASKDCSGPPLVGPPISGQLVAESFLYNPQAQTLAYPGAAALQTLQSGSFSPEDIDNCLNHSDVVSFMPPNTCCVGGTPFSGVYSAILPLDANALGLTSPFHIEGPVN